MQQMWHFWFRNDELLQVIRMNEEEHLRNEKLHMAELDHPFINKLIRTFKDQNYVWLLYTNNNPWNLV